MSNDTVCTPYELALGSRVHCLTRDESIGLVAVVMPGFMSLVAVCLLFILVLRNVIRHVRTMPAGTWRLIQTPMDLYMISLFTADFFQALGVVLEVKWIHDGVVRPGGLCQTQGITLHLGQAAVAITTLIITLHTFAWLWLKHAHTLRFAWTVVAVLWLFLVVFIAVSTSIHKEPSFYAPSPYWCWINSTYSNYRIAGENSWLWLAFAASLLYIPLVLKNRGYLAHADDSNEWEFRHGKGREVGDRGSWIMVVSALAYCAPALPTSMARWFLLIHGDVKPFGSFEAQFTVKAIFALGGVCDVLVFLLTPHRYLLFGAPPAADPRLNGA